MSRRRRFYLERCTLRSKRVKLEHIRCESGKIRYLTEDMAAEAMAVVEARDPRPGATTYPCASCGGWHWGHWTRKPKNHEALTTRRDGS